MAAITEDEAHLLKLFRQRIRDLDLNEELSLDHDLVRWIRARENNLSAAEKMLRAHMKWRSETDFDNILSWQHPPGYEKQFPVHIGVTRDNGICKQWFLYRHNGEKSHVLVFVPGRVDYQIVVANEESKQVFLKHVCRAWEEASLMMKGRTNAEGLPATQATWLMDYKGFTITSAMSVPVLGLLKDLAATFEANFPERLQSAFIMNASKIVCTLISFFKSICSSKTFGKLTVVDSDPEKLKEFLLRSISEEELPMLYGGKQADSIVNKYL